MIKVTNVDNTQRLTVRNSHTITRNPNEGAIVRTLSVTENGVFTAPDGYAYSPVTVDVKFVGGVKRKEVNFYDYDGTLLYSYALSELPLQNLPLPLDHSHDTVPLTFCEWNWSLEDVNACDTEVDVCAIYQPTDGNTHLLYELTTVTGNKPRVTLDNSGKGNITVRWGDGQVSTSSASGQVTLTPAKDIPSGQYDLTVESTANYGLGWYLFGRDSYAYSLRGVFMSEKVVSLTNDCLRNQYTLESVTMSRNVSSIPSQCFGSCYALLALCMPKKTISYGSNCFSNCRSSTLFSAGKDAVCAFNGMLEYNNCLKSFVFPQSTSDLGQYTLSSCSSLRRVVLPKNVTTIRTACFNLCLNILELDFSRQSSVPVLATASPINPLCKIKVPISMVDEWKTATNWSAYADNIVGV